MKAAIVIVPIVLICAIVGAGMTGMVNIPGLTPVKKTKPKVEPKKAAPTVQAAPRLSKKKPTNKAVVEKILTDDDQGRKRLAKLWNEIPTEDLLKIVTPWKDKELAAILLKMDTVKVAEMLTLIPPDRSSKLSREIQSLASIIPPNK